MSKFIPEAYRNYLRMSKKKHILVEGKWDRIAITFLLGEMTRLAKIKTEDISVETAEQIIGSDGIKIGNREKILDIAKSIKEKDYKIKFLGFIDREFDDFEIEDDVIRDKVCCHKSDDRILFSRGHSIENYWFETSILGLTLEGQSTIPFSDQVLLMYGEIFQEALYQACSLGLAASELQILGRLDKSFKWIFFELKSKNELYFLLEDWIFHVKENRNISDELARSLEEKFIFYLEKLRRSENFLPRWLCHGHIGIDFLYAVYCACLLNVASQAENQDKSPISHIEWVGRDALFYLLIKSWAKKALNGDCEYPEEIASFLGASTHL